MNVIIKKDYDEICEQIAEQTIEQIKSKPESLICMPGGDTPLGVFKYLIQKVKEQNIDLSKCSFVSLDEWISLDRSVKGSCIQTLFDELYDKIDIDLQNQVCFFNGKAKDLDVECQRVDKFIFDKGGIDLVVLGIGMNGHIGFNEPGVDTEKYCTIVPLDDVTRSVSVKYFGEQLNLEYGITLGMKHLLGAKDVILIANGTKKADIVKAVVQGEVSNKVPASLIRNIEKSQLFVDEEAASKL